MMANGYVLSPKSKSYHALDSFVYEYINCGGTKDNLKIEINYMLRCHVLPVARREVRLPWNEEKLTVFSVAPLEIFASKTVALLTRTAPRDLYDMHNMVKFGLFDESEEAMLRKCVVFYSAIGSAQPPEKFALDNIGNVSFRQIKRDLNSVLRKGERFDLEFVQKEVKDYLTSVLVPTKEEKLFWKAFSEGNYYPDWVFGDSDEFRNVALKNSKHLDAAMKVMQFAFGNENLYKATVEVTSVIPANSEYFDLYREQLPDLAPLVDYLETSQPFAYPTQSKKFADRLISLMQEALMNEESTLTGQEIVTQLAEEFGNK